MRKHTDQNFHMVVETQHVYEQITLPYIESIPKEKIEWVYNILDQYVSPGNVKNGLVGGSSRVSLADFTMVCLVG